MNNKKIKTALLSVSNKKKLTMLAKKLIQKKIKLFATNGTANFLKKKKINIIKICDYINFPEILNGKVKTLHPKIFGGILAKNYQDQKILKKYNIINFDLIIINFYTFKINKKFNKNYLKKISNFIDIGGPSIIRAAVKNYQNKIILTDPKDYIKIIKKINKKKKIQKKIYFRLAIKAFQYVTLYHIKILNFIKKQTIYLNKQKNKKLPNTIYLTLKKKKKLRYGENHYQKAAIYVNKIKKNNNIIYTKQIQGLQLSYNNISDSEIALECVKTLNKSGCVIVKHENPCGAAIGKNTLIAYKNAYNTDPISCFGGVIAFNDYVNTKTIKKILKNQFVEIIIAPKISKKSIIYLKKKKNIRILIYNNKNKNKKNKLQIRSINNGFLLQTLKFKKNNINKYNIVTKKKPTKKEIKDLLFAWNIVKFTKSNSIVYAKNLTTTAIGSGQTSRIHAIKIAHMKAKEQKINIKNNVLASDAFFPFRDSIDFAAKQKINCIIQPGGSIRDLEIIKSANEHNIAMIFTKIRHFKH